MQFHCWAQQHWGLGCLGRSPAIPAPGPDGLFPGHMIWVSRSPQLLPVGSLTDPRKALTSGSRQKGGALTKLQAG